MGCLWLLSCFFEDYNFTTFSPLSSHPFLAKVLTHTTFLLILTSQKWSNQKIEIVRQLTQSSIDTPQREINAFRDQARCFDKKSNLSEKTQR
jgi:hypothetical protein